MSPARNEAADHGSGVTEPEKLTRSSQGEQGRAGSAQSRTRRRGKDLERAIFDAVLDQLRTVGYGQLTMEGVAAAAQTGKAALYRRWSSKEQLVVDTLRDTLPLPAEFRATDDLREDLLTQLRFMRDAFAAAYGTAFQIVAAEAGRDSGLVRTLVNSQVIDPCVERISDILRAGIERGEINADATSDLIARTGPALVTHHCVTEGEPSIPDERLVAIVDDIMLPMVTCRE